MTDGSSPRLRDVDEPHADSHGLYAEVRAAIGPERVQAPLAPGAPAAAPEPLVPKARGPIYRLLVFVLVAISGWLLLIIPLAIVGAIVRGPIEGTILEPVVIGLLAIAWFALPILFAIRKAAGPGRGSIFPRTIRLLAGLERPEDDPGNPLTAPQQVAAFLGAVFSFFRRLR